MSIFVALDSVPEPVDEGDIFPVLVPVPITVLEPLPWLACPPAVYGAAVAVVAEPAEPRKYQAVVDPYGGLVNDPPRLENVAVPFGCIVLWSKEAGSDGRSRFGASQLAFASVPSQLEKGPNGMLTRPDMYFGSVVLQTS
jgi:hypothetical protein